MKNEASVATASFGSSVARIRFPASAIVSASNGSSTAASPALTLANFFGIDVDADDVEATRGESRGHASPELAQTANRNGFD